MATLLFRLLKVNTMLNVAKFKTKSKIILKDQV